MSSDARAYEIVPDVQRQHQVRYFNECLDKEGLLEDLQIVFVVDRSGSQQYRDGRPSAASKTAPGSFGSAWCRWDTAVLVVKYIASKVAFQYDADGKVPLYLFGRDVVKTVASSPGEIITFCLDNKPASDTTNLHKALSDAFGDNVREGQKTLFIVVTDGEPDPGQEETVARLIKERLTDADPGGDRLNILFIQVGDDPAATAYLKRLDDHPDFGQSVDTKTAEEALSMAPQQLLIAAITD